MLADVERLAADVTDPEAKERLLADVCRAAGDAGCVDQAERIAVTLTIPYIKYFTLGAIARAAAKLGDQENARRLIQSAARAAQSILKRKTREMAQMHVAKDAVRAGLLDDAERLATSGVFFRERRSKVLADIVVAASKAGQLDDAERLAMGITNHSARSVAMAAVARTAASAGEEGLARQTLHRSLSDGANVVTIDLIIKLEPEAARVVAETLKEIQQYVTGK